jgi:hypothetical protein
MKGDCVSRDFAEGYIAFVRSESTVLRERNIKNRSALVTYKVGVWRYIAVKMFLRIYGAKGAYLTVGCKVLNVAIDCGK